MENGIYSATEVGTPQGGNLSPLLSNVMLNELDKELERRGLHWVRYADDCVIAVRSSASAGPGNAYHYEMDRAQTRSESELRKDPCLPAGQTEISGIRILQKSPDAKMVDKASRKFGDEVSTDTEETLQTLVEHLHGCSNQEAEPDNPRMD